jgi:hypothetical protein
MRLKKVMQFGRQWNWLGLAFAWVLAALALASCGGGGAGGFGGSPNPGGNNPTPAKLSITLSKQQLKTGGTESVDVTVLAQSSDNLVMRGIPVTLSADSGVLAVESTSTGTNGTLTATLTAGSERNNRTITVTAKAGSLTATATVEVTGTTVTVAGPSTAATGTPVSLTINVKDSSSQPINGSAVVATSSLGNTLPTGVTTNTSGQATLTFTPTKSGTDVITVTAAGVTTTLQMAVGGTTLAVTAAAVEQQIGATQNINVSFIKEGVPQVGKAVMLSTTRGSFTGGTSVITVTTNASGVATAALTANDVGVVNVQATAVAPETATGALQLEFVSLVPAHFSIQAVPSQVGTNVAGGSTQQSLITVTVLDSSAQSYPVKNALVTFRIKQDPSRGRLLTGSALTDSNGKAVTTFVAGSTPSGVNEVQVEATVSGVAAPKVATLTVAQSPVTITIGTGNVIISHDEQTYRKEFVVLVSDSAGNAVPDANVTVVLKPIDFRKGQLTYNGDAWVYSPPILTCPNEDLNNNGNIDPFEDDDNDQRLEPGKVVVSSLSNGGKTNADGLLTVSLTYPENYALWATFDIEVSTSVNGSEGRNTYTYLLSGLAADYTDENIAPAGWQSPYGIVGSTNCLDPS